MAIQCDAAELLPSSYHRVTSLPNGWLPVLWRPLRQTVTAFGAPGVRGGEASRNGAGRGKVSVDARSFGRPL
jgi:hypothetical protein